MRAKLAGIGPGNPRLLTVEVRDLILEEERVLAFRRAGQSLANLREDIEIIRTRGDILPKLAQGPALVLASGDPMYYGIFDYLEREGVELEVYPGLSSIQYFAAQGSFSWQDAYLGSFHGREMDFSGLEAREKALYFTDSVHTPSYISKALYQKGFRGQIMAGYDLSYDSQSIQNRVIGQVFEEVSTLAVVYIRREI